MVDDEDQDKDQEVTKNMTNLFKDMFNAEKIRRNSQTFRQNNRTSPLPKKNGKKKWVIQEYKKTRMGLKIVEQLEYGPEEIK